MELKVEIRGVDKVNNMFDRKIRKIPKDLSQQGLDEIAMAYVTALQRQLEINDSVASGRLSNSFRAQRVEDNTVHVSVMGPAARYAGPLEYGATFLPGEGPPWNKIRQWADAKGIEHHKAFAIWRNFYYGLKPMKAHPYVDKAMDMARKDINSIIKRHVD